MGTLNYDLYEPDGTPKWMEPEEEDKSGMPLNMPIGGKIEPTIDELREKASSLTDLSVQNTVDSPIGKQMGEALSNQSGIPTPLHMQPKFASIGEGLDNTLGQVGQEAFLPPASDVAAEAIGGTVFDPMSALPITPLEPMAATPLADMPVPAGFQPPVDALKIGHTPATLAKSTGATITGLGLQGLNMGAMAMEKDSFGRDLMGYGSAVGQTALGVGQLFVPGAQVEGIRNIVSGMKGGFQYHAKDRGEKKAREKKELQQKDILKEMSNYIVQKNIT